MLVVREVDGLDAGHDLVGVGDADGLFILGLHVDHVEVALGQNFGADPCELARIFRRTVVAKDEIGVVTG